MNQNSTSFEPAVMKPSMQLGVGALCLCVMVVLGVVSLLRSGTDHQQPRNDTPQVSTPLFLIDLNRAEAHELSLMPGVGVRTAKRIIEDRERNGPFESIDDLQRISGIGIKTIQEIRPYCKPIIQSDVLRSHRDVGLRSPIPPRQSF